MTLAIDPQAMTTVLLAEERGTIRLSVRPVGDDEIVDVKGITPISLTDKDYQDYIEAALAQPK